MIKPLSSYLLIGMLILFAAACSQKRTSSKALNTKGDQYRGPVIRNLKLEARLEKAFGFVQENGSELMQELSATAVGQMRSDDMLTRLMKYQNSDGGWWGLTELKAPISTISSTINGLHWLLMIEERNSSSLDRTVTFLKKTQKRNGCWDEPEEILKYNPKSWMLPGEYANQLWFTSAICRYLSEHGRETDVEFDAAISFLRAGWDGERYPMYPHTHWMSMNVFGRLVNPSETDRQIVITVTTEKDLRT